MTCILSWVSKTAQPPESENPPTQPCKLFLSDKWTVEHLELSSSLGNVFDDLIGSSSWSCRSNRPPLESLAMLVMLLYLSTPSTTLWNSQGWRWSGGTLGNNSILISSPPSPRAKSYFSLSGIYVEQCAFVEYTRHTLAIPHHDLADQLLWKADVLLGVAGASCPAERHKRSQMIVHSAAPNLIDVFRIPRIHSRSLLSLRHHRQDDIVYCRSSFILDVICWTMKEVCFGYGARTALCGHGVHEERQTFGPEYPFFHQ